MYCWYLFTSVAVLPGRIICSRICLLIPLPLGGRAAWKDYILTAMLHDTSSPRWQAAREDYMLKDMPPDTSSPRRLCYLEGLYSQIYASWYLFSALTVLPGRIISSWVCLLIPLHHGDLAAWKDYILKDILLIPLHLGGRAALGRITCSCIIPRLPLHLVGRAAWI